MASAFGATRSPEPAISEKEVEKLNARIGQLVAYYNEKRPHSSHGRLTPDDVHDRRHQNLKAAA